MVGPLTLGVFPLGETEQQRGFHARPLSTSSIFHLTERPPPPPSAFQGPLGQAQILPVYWSYCLAKKELSTLVSKVNSGSFAGGPKRSFATRDQGPPRIMATVLETGRYTASHEPRPPRYSTGSRASGPEMRRGKNRNQALMWNPKQSAGR